MSRNEYQRYLVGKAQSYLHGGSFQYTADIPGEGGLAYLRVKDHLWRLMLRLDAQKNCMMMELYPALRCPPKARGMVCEYLIRANELFPDCSLRLSSDGDIYAFTSYRCGFGALQISLVFSAMEESLRSVLREFFVPLEKLTQFRLLEMEESEPALYHCIFPNGREDDDGDFLSAGDDEEDEEDEEDEKENDDGGEEDIDDDEKDNNDNDDDEDEDEDEDDEEDVPDGLSEREKEPVRNVPLPKWPHVVLNTEEILESAANAIASRLCQLDDPEEDGEEEEEDAPDGVRDED